MDKEQEKIAEELYEFEGRYASHHGRLWKDLAQNARKVFLSEALFILEEFVERTFGYRKPLERTELPVGSGICPICGGQIVAVPSNWGEGGGLYCKGTCNCYVNTDSYRRLFNDIVDKPGLREKAKEIVLEIRQYLCNTEFAPEPFTKPIDHNKLTIEFPNKILALIVPKDKQHEQKGARAFLRLPIEERRKILAIQAQNLADNIADSQAKEGSKMMD